MKIFVVILTIFTIYLRAHVSAIYKIKNTIGVEMGVVGEKYMRVSFPFFFFYVLWLYEFISQGKVSNYRRSMDK